MGLRCPDDLTLEVSFTRQNASFPTLASHPALGPVPSSADVDPEGYASKPVGNGPFKLKRAWSQGDADIRLARFDGCSTTPALAEGLLFSIQGDVASAYNQFLAGNLDICDVPVDHVCVSSRPRTCALVSGCRPRGICVQARGKRSI